MNERDFVYWLRGFFEMTKATTLTDEQTKMIQEHLNKVVIYKKLEEMSPLLHRGVLTTQGINPPQISPMITC